MRFFSLETLQKILLLENQWALLPRGAVDVPSEAVFKARLGGSSEKPGLVEEVPDHGRIIGTALSLMSLSIQAIL